MFDRRVGARIRGGRGSFMRNAGVRVRVFARTMKRTVIAAPLLTTARWPQANRRLLSHSLLCMGTFTVAVQALRSKEYVWVLCFLSITALFNPFVPMLKPAGNLPLSLVFVYIATFVISLAALNTQAIPATSGRGPATRQASFSEVLITP